MKRAPGARRARLAPRRGLLLAGLIVAALLGIDWCRAPASQVSTRLELEAIRGYQAWISPWLQKGGVRCRFSPSCSHYAASVLRRDGFVPGNFRAAWRVLRCGPWTRAGTADPP
jgi:putative membrane protein insertion efficiency factor